MNHEVSNIIQILTSVKRVPSVILFCESFGFRKNVMFKCVSNTIYHDHLSKSYDKAAPHNIDLLNEIGKRLTFCETQ